MIVQTRNPQFRVKILTQQLGELTFETTHPDVLEIVVNKRLGDPAGAFQLVLVPRSQSLINHADGWQDVVGPMDYVEIWAWSPPRTPFRPLMRGFVDTVGERFSIAGGNPDRVVVIAGRDYGKMLLNTKLYYLDKAEAQSITIFQRWEEGFRRLFGWHESDVSALPEPDAAPLPAGQTVDGPNFSPSDILQVIWDQFYEPQQTTQLGTYSVSPPAMDFVSWAKYDPWEQQLRTYSPSFFPKNIDPLTDVWSLMFAYQHRPWRELFVVEEIDTPLLVYRPAPWLNIAGSYIQDVSKVPLKTWEVSDSDIVESDLTRSDAPTINFFFTYPEAFGFAAALMKQGIQPYEGFFVEPFQSNPHIIAEETPLGSAGFVPALPNYQHYGFRIGQFPTPFLDWERGLEKDTLANQLTLVRDQGVEGNRRVVEAFQYNHLLEFGAFMVKGNEQLKIGDYLTLTDRRGPRYYVEGVQHRFRQGTRPGDGSFTTQATVTRGRGHLVRHFSLPG